MPDKSVVVFKLDLQWIQNDFDRDLGFWFAVF
jgi:hypothetical protein